MAFERVYIVWDYYDGPRSGIADYSGQPHHYACEWNAGSDDYSDLFVLKPIDQQTLALALEQWTIWRAWEAAFQRGEKTQETHPALPGQDRRYAELDAQLRARLAASANGLRAHGSFRARPDRSEVEVEWIRIRSGPCE